jgi:hypothetical protein
MHGSANAPRSSAGLMYRVSCWYCGKRLLDTKVTVTRAGPARRRGSRRRAARPRWRRRRCAASRASTALTSPPCRAAGQAAACTRVRASARSRLGGCVRARLVSRQAARRTLGVCVCFSCVPLELQAPCTRTPNTVTATYDDCTCCAGPGCAGPSPRRLASFPGRCLHARCHADAGTMCKASSHHAKSWFALP